MDWIILNIIKIGDNGESKHLRLRDFFRLLIAVFLFRSIRQDYLFEVVHVYRLSLLIVFELVPTLVRVVDIFRAAYVMLLVVKCNCQLSGPGATSLCYDFGINHFCYFGDNQQKRLSILRQMR